MCTPAAADLFAAASIYHCRGGDSRAQRRTCSSYKLPLKWKTPPICHCEEAAGRRGALSAQREEVPLGCNLAAHARITKSPGESAKRFTGTFSVKMYLTFLLRADIIKMWKPGRLPRS